MDSNENPMNTVISCEQLSNFLNEMWMDISQAETVQEIEIKLDMLDDGIGNSLAPCIGYEVLNNIADDWNSSTRILDSLKADAKDVAQRLHRGGKDGPGEEKYTSARFNVMLKRIEQIGRDPARIRGSLDGVDRLPGQKLPLRRKSWMGMKAYVKKTAPAEDSDGTNQYEMTSTTQYD